MADQSNASLLALLARGHWFLKHRARGEKPHRRFIFTHANKICWSTEEGTAKCTGQMSISSSAFVVPGAATAVLSRKRSRAAQLFSIVSDARTLDLETDAADDRNLWVRAFEAFVSRVSGQDESHAVTNERAESKAKLTSLPELSRTNLEVQLGDGSWDNWPFELRNGFLRSAGRGSVPLSIVESVRIDCRRGATGGGRRESTGGAPARPAELVLQLEGALPQLRLSGSTELLRRWHDALETSLAVLPSREAAVADTHALQPLDKEALWIQINQLFEPAFVACASDTPSALAELEPILNECELQLEAARESMPPRADLFGELASGYHSRFRTLFSVVLVKHGIDRQYLDNDLQRPPQVVRPAPQLPTNCPRIAHAHSRWLRTRFAVRVALASGTERVLGLGRVALCSV